MKYCKDLENQFAKIGFTNYKALCQTAFPWAGVPIHQPPTPNAYVFSSSTDNSDIYYIFIVGEKERGVWHIHSVSAFFQMDTVRNIEGVKLIEKSYLDDNGKLPHKSQMEKEMMDLVQIEKVNEKFFIQKGSSQHCGQFVSKRI